MATPDDVLKVVSACSGYARLEITGKSRREGFARARHIAMGIMRYELDMSWNAIATFFDCDRSTVKGGVANFETWVQAHERVTIHVLEQFYAFTTEPEQMNMRTALKHVRGLFPKGGVRMGEDFQVVLTLAGWQSVRRCYVGYPDSGGIKILAEGATWDETVKALRARRSRPTG